jgi:hypothetical protein
MYALKKAGACCRLWDANKHTEQKDSHHTTHLKGWEHVGAAGLTQLLDAHTVNKITIPAVGLCNQYMK